MKMYIIKKNLQEIQNYFVPKIDILNTIFLYKLFEVLIIISLPKDKLRHITM